MNKRLVPYTPRFAGLEKVNIEFQNRQFCENRQTVLSGLRCLSVIPEIVRGLNPDTLYTIEAIPEGAKLCKDAAGNYKGVFYKEGKIVKHAKLRAVRPSLIKAATAVGSQILLVSIAMQLNRIERSVERVSMDLHNDRMGEIYSGVNQFEQSMLVQDRSKRSRLVEHAIQTLNTGLDKSIRSLKEQIANAPESKNTFFDNWLTSKAKTAERRMGIAEESFVTCVLGIRTLSECFAVLNEPSAAEWVLGKRITDLKGVGIETAAKKSRLIEARGHILPEVVWEGFIACEPAIRRDLEACRASDPSAIECISIEFKPTELLES